MKNVLHKKGWGVDTSLSHVDPPPIPLMKKTSTDKSDGYCVKLNLRRYPTYRTPVLYEFWMPLFEHGETEEFLLFMKNFQMILAARATLETKAKVQ